MSFVTHAFEKVFGIGGSRPSAPPQVPDTNKALEASQATTDQMRQRRGLLANIYAGAAGGGSSVPVTGKTQLGT